MREPSRCATIKRSVGAALYAKTCGAVSVIVPVCAVLEPDCWRANCTAETISGDRVSCSKRLELAARVIAGVSLLLVTGGVTLPPETDGVVLHAVSAKPASADSNTFFISVSKSLEQRVMRVA